jgi:dTDP-4-dehydrorhamnose reductase
MQEKRDLGRPLNCLVVGKGGLLGGEVVSAATARGWNVHAMSGRQFPVSQVSSMTAAIQSHRPDVIVNCAAHTNVEKAESEIEESFRANAMLPSILANASRQCGALFVHVSSTGCYGAWKSEPYTELDPLQPTTLHHQSKAAGEALVAQTGCRALILRAGWLYGGPASQPKNFVWQRLQEAAKAPQILSDPTQRGNPTCTFDVVRQMLLLIEMDITGTYNCVAHGAASRLDYVASIVEASGLNCRVVPAPSGHFARRAPVSPNETALNYYLGLLDADVMPDWNFALRRYVDALMPELRRTLEARHK